MALGQTTEQVTGFDETFEGDAAIAGDTEVQEILDLLYERILDRGEDRRGLAVRRAIKHLGNRPNNNEMEKLMSEELRAEAFRYLREIEGGP